MEPALPERPTLGVLEHPEFESPETRRGFLFGESPSRGGLSRQGVMPSRPVRTHEKPPHNISILAPPQFERACSSELVVVEVGMYEQQFHKAEIPREAFAFRGIKCNPQAKTREKRIIDPR